MTKKKDSPPDPDLSAMSLNPQASVFTPRPNVSLQIPRLQVPNSEDPRVTTRGEHENFSDLSSIGKANSDHSSAPSDKRVHFSDIVPSVARIPTTVELTGKVLDVPLEEHDEIILIRTAISQALTSDRHDLREHIHQVLEIMVIPRDHHVEYALGSWPDDLLKKYLTMIHEGRIPIRLQGLIEVLERTVIPTDDVIEGWKNVDPTSYAAVTDPDGGPFTLVEGKKKKRDAIQAPKTIAEMPSKPKERAQNPTSAQSAPARASTPLVTPITKKLSRTPPAKAVDNLGKGFIEGVKTVANIFRSDSPKKVRGTVVPVSTIDSDNSEEKPLLDKQPHPLKEQDVPKPVLDAPQDQLVLQEQPQQSVQEVPQVVQQVPVPEEQVPVLEDKKPVPKISMSTVADAHYYESNMRQERYSRRTMERAEEDVSRLEDTFWKYEYGSDSGLVW